MAAAHTGMLATHWLALREAPLRVSAQDRAQAREAWRAAAEAYARSTQLALSGKQDDAVGHPAPAGMRDARAG